MSTIRQAIFLLTATVFITSCWKEETILVPDNDPPVLNNVPTIKIENYVNRLFIDLLGREPLDVEMAVEVDKLKAAGLEESARLDLIVRLQNDTAFIPGDTSYQRAYHQHLYNLAKVRCLEGSSDALIFEIASMAQDPADSIRLMEVLQSRTELMSGSITVETMFARMVYNLIYDQINMNTFNFVNATFDNLYWRYPTQSEFQAGFNMVEFGQAETLFGQTGNSKQGYVEIISQSPEMFEGLIIWVYQQLLARRPTTVETVELLEDFFTHRDIRLVQQTILVTDEYANF